MTDVWPLETPGSSTLTLHPLEVRCMRCGVRARNACVRVSEVHDLYNAEHQAKPIGRFHKERVQRAKEWSAKFKEEGRERFPCRRCGGSAPPFGAWETVSSSEHCCNRCGLYTDDPANVIWPDELLESLAPGTLLENEIVHNPDAPTRDQAFKEGREFMPGALIGRPEERDAVMHHVPRTKPIEWNPHRRAKLREEESLCPECGFNNHRWSAIVEEKYQDRSKPCWQCGAACPYTGDFQHKHRLPPPLPIE